MKVRRRNGKKRGGGALKALLALVLIVGASFGVAVVWHNASLAGGQAGQAAAAQEQPAQAAQEQVPDRQEQAAVEQMGSTGQDAGDVDGEEDPDAGRFAVAGAVPASDQVDNSYFDDAIFFGDSISTGIPLYHIADNAAVVATTGVNPSTALDGGVVRLPDGTAATMLEAAREHGEHAKVYIMLGGNGMWLDDDSFVRGYQAFIDAVREQYPGAVIYLQSLTPVTEDVGEHYEEVSNERVMELNALVLGLAQRNGLYFVNVFEALAGPDGYLPGEAANDGMHLVPEYYAKWFNYLKTHTVEG